MADLFIIEMTSDGEGRTEINLGNALVTIITRFNYSIGSWTMDIVDARGDMLLSGLMMVPGIDMLYPYPEQKEILGGLVLFERNTGDYVSDISLGIDTKLIWYPPGTEVVLSL